MVSLNTQHGRSGGGISFDDYSYSRTDEPIRDDSPLIDSLEKSYRPIKTTWFILLHIFLTIVFITSIVLIPSIICPEIPQNNTMAKCNNHSGYNIALYIHAGAYFVSLSFDRLYHHYQDLSRRDGYLEFYRQTRNLRRTPLFIISSGNALLVALIEVLENYKKFLPIVLQKQWYFLTALSSIEVLIILVVLLRYLVLTIKFNKERARPDATQDDLLSSFITSQTAANEIGFRDESFKENVLEKQADLIRYLRERNEILSRLVLQYKPQQRVNE